MTGDVRPLSDMAALTTGSARNRVRAFAVALARMAADVTVRHRAPRSQADAAETARPVREQGARAVVPGRLLELWVTDGGIDGELQSRIFRLLRQAGSWGRSSGCSPAS